MGEILVGLLDEDGKTLIGTEDTMVKKSMMKRRIYLSGNTI